MINSLLEHESIKVKVENDGEDVQVTSSGTDVFYIIKEEKDIVKREDVEPDEADDDSEDDDGDIKPEMTNTDEESEDDDDEEMECDSIEIKEETTVRDQGPELEVLRVESPPRLRRTSRRTTINPEPLKATITLQSSPRKSKTKKNKKVPQLATAKKRLACDQCPRTFNKEERLVEHQYIHTGEKPPRKTKTLKKSYEPESASPVDPNALDAKKRFVCDQCPLTFNKHVRLVEHKYQHTGEKPFDCDDCGRHFRLHHCMQEHKQKPKSICDICKMSFCSIPDLNTHKRRRHTNDRRFQCPTCPKAFGRSADYKTHLRVHTGEKPYVCDICNKCFRANQNLSVHRKSHLGDASKPYKCEHCDKRFLRKIDRKVHMRSHTGEKPFKCELCECAYTAKIYLRSHIARDHAAGLNGNGAKRGHKRNNWRGVVAKQQRLIRQLQFQLQQQGKLKEKIKAEQCENTEAVSIPLEDGPQNGEQLSIKAENMEEGMTTRDKENMQVSNLQSPTPKRGVATKNETTS